MTNPPGSTLLVSRAVAAQKHCSSASPVSSRQGTDFLLYTALLFSILRYA